MDTMVSECNEVSKSNYGRKSDNKPAKKRATDEEFVKSVGHDENGKIKLTETFEPKRIYFIPFCAIGNRLLLRNAIR
jgi:hypothetical protein